MRGEVVDLHAWLQAEVDRRRGKVAVAADDDRLEKIRAIDALYVADVYAAARTARLRRLGELPVPDVPSYSYELLERAQRRSLGLDPNETFDSLQ